MINNQIKNTFIESAMEWICDGYSASIRFVASVDGQNLRILKSTIELWPLPLDVENSFLIKTDKIFLGQIELNLLSRQELISLIDNAIQGVISTPKGKIYLPKENDFSYYSEGSQRDRWFYQLHLSISGRENQNTAYGELDEIDNSLRLSTPPFDGLQDASLWLGLNYNALDSSNPKIDIRIAPPVDLIIDDSSLNNDEFKIILHAQPQFNVDLVQVAIRAVPGDHLNTRLQIASKIEWGDIQSDRRIGAASIRVKNSDNILAILMIGKSIVRRHWFLDPAKARNNRLIAVQNFDKDLKMIRNAVLETSDPHRFENGIAALLFLLGFSPCVQLETDSPDLVVQTPNGRLILVECTLKISDFSAKIGKLVDRRGSLVKELEKSGHSNSIASVLICRLPRNQIATHSDDLNSHKVILVTEEQLNDAFDQVRYHNDPDEILEKAELTIKNNPQIPLGLKTT